MIPRPRVAEAVCAKPPGPAIGRDAALAALACAAGLGQVDLCAQPLWPSGGLIRGERGLTHRSEAASITLANWPPLVQLPILVRPA